MPSIHAAYKGVWKGVWDSGRRQVGECQCGNMCAGCWDKPGARCALNLGLLDLGVVERGRFTDNEVCHSLAGFNFQREDRGNIDAFWVVSQAFLMVCKFSNGSNSKSVYCHCVKYLTSFKTCHRI